jgi:hypothetical protein
MKVSRLFAWALGSVLALCGACRHASRTPEEPTKGSAKSATQAPSPGGKPVAGVIVSTQHGGAVMAQAGSQSIALEQNPQPTEAQQNPKPAAPQTQVPPREDVEKRLGPFTLAPGEDFFVVIHSRRLEIQPGKFDEAVAWLDIRDASDTVQYHEDFAYTVEQGAFNDQCSVGAEMLKGSMSKGIMISALCEPSAPMSGGSVQIFGIVNGKLVPFGKPLYVEGDVEGFVPGAITKQGQVTIFSADMLKFKVFTGNVFVVLPLRINWLEGKLELGMHCYEQSGHGMVESGCEVPVVEVERYPSDEEMTFVRLFPESNEQLIPEHVVVRKDSKVQVLAAKVRASLGEEKNSMGLGVEDDVWLKVRVDGKQGWIHSQEDFEAIGLPQAG